MKYKGYKIGFKQWFKIIFLRQDLQLNLFIKYHDSVKETRIIVNMIKAGVPEKAVILIDTNIIERTVTTRAMWFAISDNEESIAFCAEIDGYKALTISELIDEDNS